MGAQLGNPVNPREKKVDKPKMGGPLRALRMGSPLGFMLLIALALILLRSFFQDVGVHKVSYSQFKDAAAAGQFSKVQIAPEWVKGLVAAPPSKDKESRGFNVEGGPAPWLANRVPGDQELTKLLESKKVDYEAVPTSSWTEMLWTWMLPIGIALLFWGFMMRRLSGLGQGPQSVMAFGKARAKIHAENNTGVGFKDIAGIDEAVDELKEIVEFLKTPDKFRRLGGRIPKGVLLVGPPGTGKTLLARAVAGEAGVPFFSLSGSEFVEMFVGVGAARVRDLFAQAQAKAPCIIFIDELDSIGKSRNAAMVGGHDEREQTLNQLLSEMDGFDARVGLIILGATNRPEILDSALLRPGRFDRQVLVDRPDKRGRQRILQIHVREVKVAPDVDLGQVAARTPGLAGADLANIVNEAALLAARQNHDAVNREDFEEAIERVVAGLVKKNRRMNDREKEIVAHHEAGHAVVNWMLPHAEHVHKISIIPRGLAALGYTLQFPLEDRYLMSFDELRDKMAGIMGGRAAEEIFIGEISTGAGSDFKQATDVARMMVREYGMSLSLGPVALSEEHPSVFLRSAGTNEIRSYSEQTARLIDEEIRRLTTEALDRAREVLRDNSEKVQALVARLLTAEVIEEEELKLILGPKVVSRTALWSKDQTGQTVAPHEPEQTETHASGRNWAPRK